MSGASRPMKIAVLPGDGIGVEVTREAVKVLRAAVGDAALELVHAPIGAAGVEQGGDPLPSATLAAAQAADAILFGAAGIPGDEAIPYLQRPGASLLRLRKTLGLYGNLRPAFMLPELIGATTLKPEVVEGLDIVIIRELTGDLYYGEPRFVRTLPDGRREGVNTMRYTSDEIERVAHVAFRLARTRRRKVCSVDKANVLETMQLWREVVTEVGKQYPDVELTHAFVDAAAMMLMRQPKQFDVIVTGNVFGDILSDAAAMLTGSIGMLPSASVRDDRFGLYEPVHGTAPDIAGRDIANPLGAIFSAAMMLRHTFDRGADATRIEHAVRRALARGVRTGDLSLPGSTPVGTAAMGDAVVAELQKG